MHVALHLIFVSDDNAHVSEYTCSTFINSFLASGDFWHLLITFANSLDPDQDRQNVGPDLDPNRLAL